MARMKTYALWLEEINMELEASGWTLSNFTEWPKIEWFKNDVKPADVARNLLTRPVRVK